MAVAPPEVKEKTHVLPLAEILKSNAKFNEDVSTVSVTAAEDHRLIKPVSNSGPPDRVGCAACTTKLDEVVTLTLESGAAVAVSVTD